MGPFTSTGGRDPCLGFGPLEAGAPGAGRLTMGSVQMGKKGKRAQRKTWRKGQ